LAGELGRALPIIERRPCFRQLLPSFPLIFWFPQYFWQVYASRGKSSVAISLSPVAVLHRVWGAKLIQIRKNEGFSPPNSKSGTYFFSLEW